MPYDTGFRDGLGRPVWLLEVTSFETLPVALPLRPHFILFICSDARSAPAPVLLAFATALLLAGGVYAACWGPGCADVEEAFDYADVFLRPESTAEDVVLTTSHEEEALTEALDFVSHTGYPATAYESSCWALLVILVGSATTPSEVVQFFAGGRGETA